jgi:hypothetical protein
MARSINDIKVLITNKYVAEMAAIGEVVDPTTWSATSLERCAIFVFAYCQYVLENLFDVFKTEVAETIAAKNPHTLRWYAEKAKAYQHGYSVVTGTDVYDNSGLTDAQIAASKIVAYTAATEELDGLSLKVAKDTGDLVPLSGSELAGLQDYFGNQTNGIKDAGVFITFINQSADGLKASIDVYYNPTILDGNGVDISSGASTVADGAKAYLKMLPFNGVFAAQNYQDYFQKIEGVVYIKFNSLEVSSDAGANYQAMDVYYIPVSGYLRYLNSNDLTINYIPYSN